MCDNTQQHIEIWNLVWCLVPLHWSKVVLKIVSPHAPNPRTKSGIAALCTLFILFCLERPVACFPVVYKHFYDFFPLLLPVFTCCKQRPDFEWHHPSYSIPDPCNNSGCAWSPGGACLTRSLKLYPCQGFHIHSCTAEQSIAQCS